MEGYLKLCLELVICSLDCRNVTFFIKLKYKIYVIYVFHLFSYSFQLPRATRTHNSVLYPGANQRFSILCRWQRNKSYSRGWISVSLQLKIKKGGIDHCHTAAILSLLSLLRQKGCHMTKVYWGVLWLWRGGCGGEGRGKLACTKH